MVKVYIYIDDHRIYGIYEAGSGTLYISTNPKAVNGIIVLR